MKKLLLLLITCMILTGCSVTDNLFGKTKNSAAISDIESIKTQAKVYSKVNVLENILEEHYSSFEVTELPIGENGESKHKSYIVDSETNIHTLEFSDESKNYRKILDKGFVYLNKKKNYNIKEIGRTIYVLADGNIDVFNQVLSLIQENK